MEYTQTSTRFEKSAWKQFSAICAALDTTPSDVLREYVDRYIEEHRDAAINALRE